MSKKCVRTNFLPVKNEMRLRYKGHLFPGTFYFDSLNIVLIVYERREAGILELDLF
jgi:hypothetical protein